MQSVAPTAALEPGSATNTEVEVVTVSSDCAKPLGQKFNITQYLTPLKRIYGIKL